MSKETMTPLQDELLKRADSIFASISEAAKTGAEFAKEQIPDIAYQYVAFGRAYETAVMVGILLFLLITAVGGFFVARKIYHKSDEPVIFLPYGILVFFCSVFSFGILVAHLQSFMMVWFAPKIWLITEIVKLVK